MRKCEKSQFADFIRSLAKFLDLVSRCVKAVILQSITGLEVRDESFQKR